MTFTLPTIFKPRPLDAQTRAFAPGICSSYHLILLHSLVTIVLSYQLLFSTDALLSFEAQELVVIALIASVAGLTLLPARFWACAWLVSALVIADTLATTAVIYASGQASSGLYLAYFLIILLAACAPTLTQMLGLATLLCLAYGAVLYLELGQLGTLMAGHLLRVPVLLILAVFYGMTIDAVRKLHREKTSLVDDLHEKERQAEELRESKEHFEAFMDNNPAVAFMKDAEGRYVYANKPFERRLRLDRPTWLGKTDFDLWPANIARQLRDNDQSVLTAHKPLQFKETVPLPNRTTPPWMVLKFPLRDSGGRQFLGGMALELTEWEQLDEQFSQARRLEVVGRLAGGVAHDFNNLLLVILGHCDLLLNLIGLQKSARHPIEQIKRSGERAASLTQQLLAFSRRQILQPKVLDLNAIVSNVEQMLRRVIGEDIRLTARLGTDIGRVEVDPGQMDQVIMNLAINARDAMPHGGDLVIATEVAEFEEPSHVGGITIRSGPYVVLRVTDTGIGMDAETKARVFEPFFTTKGVGQGTGLGLATVYGIVKQSGGYIFVQSEVSKGSTFTVYLPQVSNVPTQPAAVTASAATPVGSETVLLVEDDKMVRDLLRTVLKSQGYTVLEAASGPEALQISERRPESIQLAITDMILPEGMNGREVVEGLRLHQPGIKLLYMSGYTEDMILRCGGVAQGAMFLQKPFTPDVLASTVRQALDQPGPSLLPVLTR